MHSISCALLQPLSACAWPHSFHMCTSVNDEYWFQCWSIPAIQWALDNGSTWLDWQCSQLAPQHYNCSDTEHNDDECWNEMCEKRLAADVFAWAHENGCPCTCGQSEAAEAAADRRRVYRY
jgi:hypothetical protein